MAWHSKAGLTAYCGSFTAGGLEVATGDGLLQVTREGKFKKFVSAVEQITFSGTEAARGPASAGAPQALSS